MAWLIYSFLSFFEINPHLSWSFLIFLIGFPNGKCIKSSINNTKNVCEVFAWCPVENDETVNNIISGILNYTIFVRNNIEFEKFDKKEYLQKKFYSLN
jgi:hypothetical protein